MYQLRTPSFRKLFIQLSHARIAQFHQLKTNIAIFAMKQHVGLWWFADFRSVLSTVNSQGS